MSKTAPHLILCNGAQAQGSLAALGETHIRRMDAADANSVVKLSLLGFKGEVFHLPERILDLLEIAAYVYCADRLTSRGDGDAVEYHAWSRSFEYVVKVRDFAFWDSPAVKQKLSEALCFMSGDMEYQFSFQSGHRTDPTSLFDTPGQDLSRRDNASLVLFSGGLDSLTGAVDRLANTREHVCLVSHHSGQPGTIRTQRKLFDALASRYPGRVQHYPFYCSLRGLRAEDETQRTRVFLYCSIAYALCQFFGRKLFYVYENGITSLNFPKREDLKNARASRTTHPRTVALLGSFFELLEGSPFKIETPFLWKTKADVLSRLSELGGSDMIASSVSCSKTFRAEGQSTQCGGCSQCVDRRFAAYASGLNEWDETGIYAEDFILKSIPDGEARTTILDYVRQACKFANWKEDAFYREMLDPLVAVTPHVGIRDQSQAVAEVWGLCNRHGNQVLGAMKRMQQIHEELSRGVRPGSLLHMIADREYLKQPTVRLVETISGRLSKSIPLAFRSGLPDHENKLNDVIGALLASDRDALEREHPAISFALAGIVPDHSYPEYDLLIEAKYIRKSTSPSKATDGMAADFFKYPIGSHILYVVYDPHRRISDDDAYRKDFEQRYDKHYQRDGICRVCIVR